MRDVVVVGAGLAGARTCERLRAAGFAGRLVLLGAEPDPPYDRPPLTKDPDAEVDLRTAMGLDVFAAADEVRLGCEVSGLRAAPGGFEVQVRDGSAVPAGVLVVATGAQPAPRAQAGAAGLDDGVGARASGPEMHVLHTRGQAAGFWARVTPGVRLRVVGGGWVGCEAAATAAARGAVVELVEARATLLAGRVPAAVAERIRGWLTGAGVAVHTGRGGEAGSTGEPGAPGAPGTLGEPGAGGGPEVVLLALGVRPATAWLAGAGVDQAPDGAVLTDPWGRTSLPGVFAVGDAAARWSPRYRAHLPGGHWTGALADPETVAPVVAWTADPRTPDPRTPDPRTPDAWTADPGVPAADPLPYVFSEIAGRTLLVLGRPEIAGDHEVVWRGTAEAWTAYSVDGAGRLVGLCSSGRPRDLAAARRAMLSHPRGAPLIDPQALADPEAPPSAPFVGES